MSDPLGMWWTQPVVFRPRTGTNANGPVYGSPVTELCRVSHTVRQIRDTKGVETVSTSRISYSADRPAYPAGSLASVDGRWREVIESGTHRGNPRTPDYTHASLK